MKNKPAHIVRFPLLTFISTLPKDIRIFFYLSSASILSIELIGKRVPAINHLFFVWGDVWLKFSCSLYAAIIFYFINQHLPRQKRKLKSLLFISHKLVGVYNEVVLLIKTLSTEPVEQDLSKLTRNWINELCKKVNSQLPLISTESSTPFINWFEYINYKTNKIKVLINDLLPLEDIIESELIGPLYLIDQHVT